MYEEDCPRNRNTVAGTALDTMATAFDQAQQLAAASGDHHDGDGDETSTWDCTLLCAPAAVASGVALTSYLCVRTRVCVCLGCAPAVNFGGKHVADFCFLVVTVA